MSLFGWNRWSNPGRQPIDITMYQWYAGSGATVAGPWLVMRHDHSSPIGLFQPGVILPAQLLASVGANASTMPETRLLLAVLEEAAVTFQRNVGSTHRRGQRLFREAEEWILADDPSWPCSFHNVCEALGFDVQCLRRGFLAWRDRQRSCGTPPVRYRHPFRRLSGSRTRAIGRPIGLRGRPVREWSAFA
jgi:hypothetical protein